MKAKIYRPCKNAMQSGVRNTRKWLLVFEPEDRKFIDPLMGWTGSTDTKRQLKMKFTTLNDALEYARQNGIEAEVHENEPKAIKPKAYADNFSFKRIRTGLIPKQG